MGMGHMGQILAEDQYRHDRDLSESGIIQAPESSGRITTLAEAESQENTKWSTLIGKMPTETAFQRFTQTSAKVGFFILKIITLSAAHFLDKGRKTTTKEWNKFTQKLVRVEKEGTLDSVVLIFNNLYDSRPLGQSVMQTLIAAIGRVD